MSGEKYEYKLTAVVLVYNGLPYLRKCLESLVNQTLDGLEILLINDVSTDDSLSVCREFERDYDNVRVIDKEINEGLATNANLGIELAKGEYVILVDNDDIIPVDAYEKLYTKAKENDADISVGKANFIVGNYQQEMNYNDKTGWEEERVINDINEFPLLFHDAFYWNKIMRRDMLLEHNIRLPIGMIYADRLFSHTAYIHANKISIIPDCVYLWRRHESSLSMKREKIENYINRLDSYDMNLDDIINHYPDYIKIMEENCKESGGSFLITDDREAVKGADFIYTDVWYGLYEDETPVEERVAMFKDYQVNRELMSLGNIGCKFMHCLPCTRGEDVTDEVADSDSSLCWEEAGNRLTAMRGLLVWFTQYQRANEASELQKAAAKERLEKFMADREIV